MRRPPTACAAKTAAKRSRPSSTTRPRPRARPTTPSRATSRRAPPAPRFARGPPLSTGRCGSAPAEPVPDLTAAILGAAAARRPPAPVREWARYALFAVAAHPARARAPRPAPRRGPRRQRPRRSRARQLRRRPRRRPALGRVATAPRRRACSRWRSPSAGAIALTAVLDVVQGDAGAWRGEAHHVLDLAGLVLLWPRSPDRRSAAHVAPPARASSPPDRASPPPHPRRPPSSPPSPSPRLASPAAAHAVLAVDRPRRPARSSRPRPPR